MTLLSSSLLSSWISGCSSYSSICLLFTLCQCCSITEGFRRELFFPGESASLKCCTLDCVARVEILSSPLLSAMCISFLHICLTAIRRAQFRTPSSVSFFCPRRVPGGELSEFLSAYYLCSKVNSPSFWQNSPSLPKKKPSEFSPPKQYSRNSIPPVPYFEGQVKG